MKNFFISRCVDGRSEPSTYSTLAQILALKAPIVRAGKIFCCDIDFWFCGFVYKNRWTIFKRFWIHDWSKKLPAPQIEIPDRSIKFVVVGYDILQVITQMQVYVVKDATQTRTS